MVFSCLSTINEGDSKNTVSIIPVIVDIELSDLPWFVNWITFVQKEEKNYKERLLEIIKGKYMYRVYIV